MSASPLTYELELLLAELTALMDFVIPGLAGSSADLFLFLQQVRERISYSIQTTLIGLERATRPFEFDQPWLDALQWEVRTLRNTSTADHAVAELLKPLRKQGLIAGPNPRIRLTTPRELAVSLQAERIWHWNDIQGIWEQLLRLALARQLPGNFSQQSRKTIQRLLDEAAWEAILGLVIEGRILYDRLARAISHAKLTDFDSGFLPLPTRIGKTPTSACPTNPFPLNLAAQVLVNRYLLLRARLGERIDSSLEYDNPDTFLFHNAIRHNPKGFHRWLASLFPANPYPNIAPPTRGFPVTNQKSLRRPRIAAIVDACRAASIFDLWPILVSDRSGLQASRPPTKESWEQLVLQQSASRSILTSEEPRTVAKLVLDIPLAIDNLSSDANASPPRMDIAEIFGIIDPLDTDVASILRQLKKTTTRATRRSWAASLSDIIAKAPECLGETITESIQAPISNYVLFLQWLQLILDPPKSWPGKDLAPNTIRRYAGAVRRGIIPATETLNLLSITEAADSIAVIAQALAADPTAGAKKNTKDGLLHFFRFIHWKKRISPLDADHPDLWLPAERAPYPLLLPEQVDLLVEKLPPSKSIIAILASYVVSRRSEIAALRLRDLQHSCSDLRLSIRHSKTRNGRRDSPLLILIPARYRTMVLEYWQERWKAVRHLPHPLDQPLIVDEAGNCFSDDALGKAMNVEIKDILGQNFSLHSLRHAGSSWLILVWFVLCYGRPVPSAIGPDFKHPLFSDDHLNQVRRMLLGETAGLRSKGRVWGTNFLDVLRVLMGHARSCTTVDTYIQTLSLVQNYFLQKNPASLGVAHVWQTISLKQASNLLACSTTEARDRLDLAQPVLGTHSISLRAILAAQLKVINKRTRKQSGDQAITPRNSNLPETIHFRGKK